MITIQLLYPRPGGGPDLSTSRLYPFQFSWTESWYIGSDHLNQSQMHFLTTDLNQRHCV